jgi:hypothetical protein
MKATRLLATVATFLEMYYYFVKHAGGGRCDVQQEWCAATFVLAQRTHAPTTTQTDLFWSIERRGRLERLGCNAWS